LAETDLRERGGLLRRKLADPDEAVVQCALLALRKHPVSEAVRELLPLLSRGDALTARLAGEALLACGEKAVPDLLEVVRAGRSRGLAEAVRALARLEDPRAVPVLYEQLDSESALVTYWAEEGLGRLGVGMVFFKPGS
jgi:HEAT repeat protein